LASVLPVFFLGFEKAVPWSYQLQLSLSCLDCRAGECAYFPFCIRHQCFRGCSSPGVSSNQPFSSH